MKTKRILEIAEEIKQLLKATQAGISVNYVGQVECNVHDMSYEEATTLFRELGIGKREKHTFAESEPWSTLTGTSEDGVKLCTFIKGLPPTCHLEKWTERIPKQETVDTGEFIEVERVKVVCTNGDTQ